MLIPRSLRIWLATEPVDFRKSINGLSGVVRQQLDSDPLCGHVWVFHNRRRSALKLLFWDTGGFVLVYKRLARGRFRVPEVGDTAQVRLSAAELTALLEGIDLSRAKRLARWNPPDDVVDPQRSDSRAHEPGHAPRRPRSPQGAGARPG
ncbi:MAG: IS66 family insertion sequence element accessory protein TnpB [Alphaproteobacteria bacterium]|nr:IS66 family insertion sequence element accessory protein TnpB [Alphaproteobacteria bacterium]MCB9793073.1 IS66 family insertion sequence element accessory protein TnpB [Alphaproteobacteria bacterium]MCB9795378.1 IS66 family insertion sequence element accessory protein TnpB [Alphaproteobacteria bacterium]